MSLFFAKKEAQEEDRYLAELPVASILPNPDQPRRSFDEETIDELAASIAQVGLIQPVIVRPSEEGFVLVSGERRLRAVKKLGMQSVRCIVDETGTEEQNALKAIIENLQREDIHFFEEAECYAKLIKRFSVTQEGLALKLGKTQSFIANKLRLLRLPPELRLRITEAGLSERHARVLLKLPEGELREAALKKMAASSLSVKESEKLAEKLLRENEEKKLSMRQKPRIIRIFRDYRIFINTVNAACDQLRESGLTVEVDQRDIENGVDITIKVTQ